MIHLFCALKCEAKPLLEQYRLQHHPDSGLFNIYINGDRNLSLTVSGVGKLAMAAAVTYTASFLHLSRTDGCLNFGIAGHRDLETGTARLVNKITDMGSNRTWFPQIVFDSSIPGTALITVDKQVSVYPGTELYDMEAAGFYDSTSRFTTAEMAHCLKIVSDNRLYPAEKINHTYVSRLIADNLEHLCAVIARLSALSDELHQTGTTQGVYDSITTRWHFTQTEKIKFKQLLNRWQVLIPAAEPLAGLPRKIQSGKEILIYLQQTLDAVPIRFK